MSIDRAYENHGEFINRAAGELDVDPTIIAGILSKEIGGGPVRLGNKIQKLLMITGSRKYGWPDKFWVKDFKNKYPNKSLPDWAVRPVPNFTGSDKIYREAYRLYPRAALKNTSWGLAQVHAWSYEDLGYSSPEEMVEALKSNEEAQKQSLIDFIKTKSKLHRDMREADWWAIGYWYNGDQKGKYGNDLQKMYKSVNPEYQMRDIETSLKDWKENKKNEPEEDNEDFNKDDGRVRIAFIGDSNANLMAARYKEDEDNQDKNLRNFSAGGWGVDLSTKSWLKTLELYKKALDSGDEKVKGFSSEARKANRLLKFRPDVITVLNLGGNDVGTFRKNPDAYKEKAKRLMELVDEFGGSYIGAAAVPASIKTRTALNAALAEVAEEVGVKFYNPTENTPYGTRRGVWSGIGDMVHLGSVEARKEYEKRKEAGLSDFAASEKRAKPAARSQKLPKDLLETGTPSDVLKAAANIVIRGNKKAEYKKWIQSTKGNPNYIYINAYKGSVDPSAVIKDFENIDKFARTGKWQGDEISPETKPVAYEIVGLAIAKQYVQKSLPISLEEINKGNNQMKIAQERLAQIIKEEVEAYKVSQLNEIDVDELEEEEAYIKEIADLLKGTYDTFFQSAAPAVGTPQTKADTGERVTDQTAHEDAKGILLDLLGNAIDEFQEKGSMHEDGHDDVPSAVRAMKTMAEDALEMLDALEQMDGTLPTWWTNKMAVSASMLNKMRDYLLVPSMEEEMDEQ